MNKLTRNVLILLLVIFLSNCTQQPAATPPVDKKLTWQQRETELSQIKSWNIQGQLGITHAKGADSATFNWQQYSQASYQLTLMGPVGTGYGTVIGKPGKVTYLAPKNKTYTATNSTALLKQQTGWYLPIDNMYYWIRGLPVPGVANQPTYDNFNHLVKLNQDGWQVSFQQYTAARGVDLPSKISMTNTQLKVKLIVSAWSF